MPGERPLTPKQLAGLEAAFSAEIHGQLTSRFEIPAATARQLIARGLLREAERTLPPTRDCPWKVVIKGYDLTHAGRIAYCTWAATQPGGEDADG